MPRSAGPQPTTNPEIPPDPSRVHLTFFGGVCFSLLHLVRFRRWMRLKILGRVTIEALETPNQSDTRKHEIKSTKKHETHPSIPLIPNAFPNPTDSLKRQCILFATRANDNSETRPVQLRNSRISQPDPADQRAACARRNSPNGAETACATPEESIPKRDGSSCAEASRGRIFPYLRRSKSVFLCNYSQSGISFRCIRTLTAWRWDPFSV